MESCLVCLEINNELVDCIKVDSTQWQEHSMQHLIDKHLWTMESILPSSWICLNCWQVLLDFHKFYMRVEEAHMDFGKLMKTESNTCSQEKYQDLVERHLEVEISMDQLEDLKPNIKQEVDVDLHDDNVLIAPRIVPCMENIKQDPLEKSNRKNTSKCKKRKKEKKNTGEKPESDIFLEKCNMSSDSKKLDNSNKDIDYEPDLSDSDNSIIEFKPEEEEDEDNNKRPELTHKQKDLYLQANYKMSCDQCRIPIDNFRNLLKHFETEHGERGYAICCNKKYYERGKLLKHVFGHSETDNVENKIGADDDPNRRPKQSSKQKDLFLTEHFKMSCVLCEIPIENFRNLSKHFEDVHKERGYAVCCNKKFYERCNLLDHVNSHLEPKNFACNECGKILSSEKSLKSHQLIHLPEEKQIACNECGKCFARQVALSNHIRVMHANKFVKICDVCGKSLHSRDGFRRHMLKHEGKLLPSSCDICGQLCVSSFSLWQHKSIHHPVDAKKQHICNICFKISPNMCALRKHISDVHKAKCNHKCAVCEKSFKRPLALREHMATHTGIALYSCPWCPRQFNASGGLHAHRKRQHPTEWKVAQSQKFKNLRLLMC